MTQAASNIGVPPLTIMKEMSGLEFLRRIIDGRLPRPPITETLGFDLAEVSSGFALFTMTPQFRHYNPIGTVHGGVAATLLDSCMSCAVQTTIEAGLGYTTLEIKVNMVTADHRENRTDPRRRSLAAYRPPFRHRGRQDPRRRRHAAGARHDDVHRVPALSNVGRNRRQPYCADQRCSGAIRFAIAPYAVTRPPSSYWPPAARRPALPGRRWRGGSGLSAWR
jgi:hypothetical protein